MKIAGCVALVTGANRGIGEAFVPELLDRGATKVYAAARDPALVEHLVKLDPRRVVALRLDVTKLDQVAAAAKVAPDLTLLINNAGISHFGTTLLHPDAYDCLHEEFEVNVVGPFNTCRAFAGVLARNGGGALVNILSASALMNVPLLPTYSATKAAALSMTQGMRASLSAQKTLVSAAIVGSVDTRLAKDVPGNVHKEKPRDIAKAVLDGIERREEDIDTDPMAVDMRARIARDPKKTERFLARGLQMLDKLGIKGGKHA